MELYVVLGEHGEYSDRDVWVSGVYTDLAAAKAEVERRLAIRRAYDQWAEEAYRQQNIIRRRVPTTQVFRMLTDDERAEADRAAGPEPEYESAERCTILAVTTDKWDKWPEVGEYYADALTS